MCQLIIGVNIMFCTSLGGVPTTRVLNAGLANTKKMKLGESSLGVNEPSMLLLVKGYWMFVNKHNGSLESRSFFSYLGMSIYTDT